MDYFRIGDNRRESSDPTKCAAKAIITPTHGIYEHPSKFRSGSPYEVEARLRRRDGQYRWFFFRFNPVLDEQGRLTHWYAAATDIEDRKQAEEKLRKSESYLAEAQRLSHTGSWAWSPATGEITYWSEECYRVWGFDPQGGQPRFETFFQRIHPHDQAKTRENFDSARREKAEFEMDYRIAHPSGKIRDIHAVGHPVLSPSGDLVEFVGTARWAQRGIKGWSWGEVLAAYKALENTPTGDDAWHGRSGPLPIRQRTAEENTPSMRAFVEASEALGLIYISDFNGASQHGVGPYPLHVVDGVRVNTGMAYLTDAVRARPNLTIRGDAEVDSVVIQGKRAVGVELVDREVIRAGEIILAAGTFGSPAILMRSGIGPSQHLHEFGIATIADLPVGNRLQDQPFFYNVYALKREVNAMKPAAGAIVWTRSQSAQPGDLDLHISGTHYFDPNASPTGGACQPVIHARRHTSITTFSMIRTTSTGWWRQCSFRGRSAEPRRSRTLLITR